MARFSKIDPSCCSTRISGAPSDVTWSESSPSLTPLPPLQAPTRASPIRDSVSQDLPSRSLLDRWTQVKCSSGIPSIGSRGEEKEVLKPHKTTVSVTHPDIEVIHPITFQSVKVQNHESMLPDLKNGQKVKVVVAAKKVFLI